MAVEVKMPQLGESVHEGTIGKWLKREGDQVAEFEPLLEVVTDKVDTEVTAPGSGTVLSIVVPEGETVPVGTLLATIGTPSERLVAGGTGAAQAGAPAAPQGAPAAAGAAPGAPSGAVTAPGPQPVDARASADAGTSSSASPASMRATPVAVRLAAEHGLDPSLVAGTGRGGQVTRADVERHLAEAPATAAAEAATGAAQGAATAGRSSTDGPAAAPAAGDGGGPERGGATFISPRVARLAMELGVDLRRVPGTGRDGRITARDVEEFASSSAAAAASVGAGATPAGTGGVATTRATGHAPMPPAAEVPAGASGGIVGEVIALTPIRRSIAEHMVRSKQTSPHVSTVHEVDMSAVMAAHRGLKDSYAERGVKLTITAFIVQAVAEALVAHPLVNSSWTEEGIRVHPDVNIGLAVAIPTGLIVPVIRNAGEKSLMGLARDVTDLATRARSKQLRPDDVQGGTFTITNYGTLGSLFGTPVINQPQAAILGTGAIKKRVVVVEGPEGDSLAIRPHMFLSLTFDHRILDGGTADPFVQTVVRKLEGYRA